MSCKKDILKPVLNCLSTQPRHSAAHLATGLHRHPFPKTALPAPRDTAIPIWGPQENEDLSFLMFQRVGGGRYSQGMAVPGDASREGNADVC